MPTTKRTNLMICGVVLLATSWASSGTLLAQSADVAMSPPAPPAKDLSPLRLRMWDRLTYDVRPLYMKGECANPAEVADSALRSLGFTILRVDSTVVATAWRDGPNQTPPIVESDIEGRDGFDKRRLRDHESKRAWRDQNIQRYHGKLKFSLILKRRNDDKWPREMKPDIDTDFKGSPETPLELFREDIEVVTASVVRSCGGVLGVSEK